MPSRWVSNVGCGVGLMLAIGVGVGVTGNHMIVGVMVAVCVAESANDVAFLFKNLESAASENAFVVHVDKKGNYRVQYLGTGGTSGGIIDRKQIIGAVKDFGTKKIWFVHNHPSGNLEASDADIRTSLKMEESLKTAGVEMGNPIIIDLDKGKYAEIVLAGPYSEAYDKTPITGETHDIKVYQFDRLKFYGNSNDKTKITSSKDVATFLSKQKRGTTDKFHVLILDRGNNVNRYYLIDETIPISNFIKQLYDDVGKYGDSVILASNGSIDSKTTSKIKQALSKIDVDLLDVLTIKQDSDIIKNYESAADKGLLHGMGELMDEDMKKFVQRKIRKETIGLLKGYIQFPILKEK